MQQVTAFAAPPHGAAMSHTAARNLDLADLLDLVPVGGATVTAHQVEDVADITAEPVKRSLNDLYTNYLAFEANLDAMVRAQVKLEHELFGEGWRSTIDAPSTQGIQRIAAAAVERLITLAEHRFAPASSTLSIDRYEVLKATGQSEWDRDFHRRHWEKKEVVTVPVDLDVLWKYLEKTYGGDAGANASYRQQAKIIIDCFQLGKDDSIKRTASSVSLSMRVYSQKKDYGQNNGKYEVGSYSNDLCKRFMALSCIFEWCGLDELALALRVTHHPMAGYSFGFAAREKHSFPGLDVVTFKDKWEFKVRHDVAEALQRFLGEFGSE